LVGSNKNEIVTVILFFFSLFFCNNHGSR
jgi:hypothetical protein